MLFLIIGSTVKLSNQPKQIQTTMSATIMMPQAFDQAVREMCGDAMAQAVASLAEKYDFDADEATRFLDLDEIKIARKRGPSPKKEETPSKSKSKSKKEAKTKTDEDKPKTKRAPTGYLMYSKAVRDEVKTELTAALGEDDKLKPQEVVVAIAAKWKALEQEERDEWNTKAKTPVTSDEE